MEISLMAIDELNNAFKDFWDNNTYFSGLGSDTALYFKEVDLDFRKQSVQRKTHVVLVYPNITGNERTSLSDTYNLRSSILFALRLYTGKKKGNLSHQKATSELASFFSERKVLSAFKRGETLIVGGTITSELPNWIISNISSEYETNEEKTLE